MLPSSLSRASAYCTRQKIEQRDSRWEEEADGRNQFLNDARGIYWRWFQAAQKTQNPRGSAAVNTPVSLWASFVHQRPAAFSSELKGDLPPKPAGLIGPPGARHTPSHWNWADSLPCHQEEVNEMICTDWSTNSHLEFPWQQKILIIGNSIVNLLISPLKLVIQNYHFKPFLIFYISLFKTIISYMSFLFISKEISLYLVNISYWVFFL